MPRYTHRPTFPDLPSDDDRLVCCDGLAFARVYTFNDGSKRGRWGWIENGGGPDSVGTAETRGEALQLLKQRHQARRREEQRDSAAP